MQRSHEECGAENLLWTLRVLEWYEGDVAENGDRNDDEGDDEDGDGNEEESGELPEYDSDAVANYA